MREKGRSYLLFDAVLSVPQLLNGGPPIKQYKCTEHFLHVCIAWENYKIL